jgi:hypothetical protein
MSTSSNGTQTMIAALEIATGKVVAHVRNRRTSVNFLRFMNDVVRAYPNRELHLVVDNLNIHQNEAARRWLAASQVSKSDCPGLPVVKPFILSGPCSLECYLLARFGSN